MPEMRKQSQASYMRPNRKTNGSGIQADETRICVVMVGLPARGKSLIASKSKATCLSLQSLWKTSRETDWLIYFSHSRTLPRMA